MRKVGGAIGTIGAVVTVFSVAAVSTLTQQLRPYTSHLSGERGTEVDNQADKETVNQQP